MDKTKKFDLKKVLLDNGIIVLLMLLVIYVSITEPNFRSFRNIMNLAINAAPRVIIALGVSACLITKGTDLSAGRMVGLSACLSGIMLQKADAPGKVGRANEMFPCSVLYAGSQTRVSGRIARSLSLTLS